MGLFDPPKHPRPPRPPPGQFFFAGRSFPRVKWWRKPRLLRLYVYCIVLILVNVANGLQSLPYWQDYFGHPTGVILGLLSSAMSLGGIIALPISPFIADKWGRKVCIILGSLILILGVGLQAGALNYHMFLASRYVLGFGMGLSCGGGPLLVAEIAHPQDRAGLTTFMGSAYIVGAFIASWTTFGTLKIPSNWAWRLPSLLQAWATVIIMLFIFFIPESPRWYIDNDQHEKALEVLAYYHAEGDDQDEVVQLEYTEIRTAIDLDRSNASTYADFLKTPGNRKRLTLVVAMAVFSQWSGNGIIGYYLYLVLKEIGITSPEEQLGINGGSKAMSLVVSITMVFFIDRLGRRPIMMISTVGMLFGFVMWTILSARYDLAHVPNPTLGRAVVGFMYVYNFMYNIKSGLPTTYTLEIMTYGLRAKGGAIYGFVTMATVFFNQFINPMALKALNWRYYIVYCVFLGFEVVFIHFYWVETRYVPMEEIARLFDGDDSDISALTNAQSGKEIEAAGSAFGVEQVESKRRRTDV